MKKHIQIKDSYNTWNPKTMEEQTESKSIWLKIEWWLHNIVYWLTKPFTKNTTVKKLNDRSKDVDLEVEVNNEQRKAD